MIKARLVESPYVVLGQLLSESIFLLLRYKKGYISRIIFYRMVFKYDI